MSRYLLVPISRIEGTYWGTVQRFWRCHLRGADSAEVTPGAGGADFLSSAMTPGVAPSERTG